MCVLNTTNDLSDCMSAPFTVYHFIVDCISFCGNKNSYADGMTYMPTIPVSVCVDTACALNNHVYDCMYLEPSAHNTAKWTAQ